HPSRMSLFRPFPQRADFLSAVLIRHLPSCGMSIAKVRFMSRWWRVDASRMRLLSIGYLHTEPRARIGI
ncbi:MAG: hypothetical protein P8178_06085, partial [Candidatus Thiodiazotropha sp.]